MTRPTIHQLLTIAAAATALVLAGCDSTQTGNPERMQKSLDQQRKAMGTPGQSVPKMPTGPGMPHPGNPGSTGPSGGVN
ncbi:MAG: hypothetical protein ACYC96_09025 [Fimbriimonadaceae bacterium]